MKYLAQLSVLLLTSPLAFAHVGVPGAPIHTHAEPWLMVGFFMLVGLGLAAFLNRHNR